ncbi:hypothetical protein [Caldimonas brevitalea]|uniref:Uncharacterized protein n=1 Tax=Caldimonas brevitalea TaxID=413882 RepID=A0A0G3BQN8_9BURK|nr:hypothetical protein [Caldimonas brevitalea]AKJ28835.1 hypothetical protein AAW51_2144 [Caldimonas brevitalea]
MIGGWFVVNTDWARRRTPATQLHVLPLADLREHQPNARCWCHPVQDEDEFNVVVHTSLDGREAFESGERKPS